VVIVIASSILFPFAFCYELVINSILATHYSLSVSNLLCVLYWSLFFIIIYFLLILKPLNLLKPWVRQMYTCMCIYIHAMKTTMDVWVKELASMKLSSFSIQLNLHWWQRDCIVFNSQLIYLMNINGLLLVFELHFIPGISFLQKFHWCS